MNRRNALIGLGAIATGGGALFGSGAFSTVEADRTMSVGVSGDASAEVILSPTSAYATTSTTGTNSGNELALTFDNLNDDARSTFTGVFDIENNDSDGNAHDVYVDTDQSSSEIDGSIIDFRDSGSNSITAASASGTSANASGLASGSAVSVEIFIDSTASLSTGSDLNVTIVAE